MAGQPCDLGAESQHHQFLQPAWAGLVYRKFVCRGAARGTLYGLQHSNPVDTVVAYHGPASNFGEEDDPMVGHGLVA